MLRKIIHSKIHMARVTDRRPEYSGSLTVDADVLDACGMRPNDAVLVANCRNGARFETYIFEGDRGSGELIVNGAAAHRVEEGDAVIVIHFALVDDREYAEFRPTVLLMDEANRVAETIRYEPGLRG